MKLSPMKRLDFWTVAHQLRHRLENYQVSQVARPFRRFNWNDLRYWQLLIEEPELFNKPWNVVGLTEALESDDPAPFDLDPSYR